MVKGQQYSEQKKRRPGERPARKHVPRSSKQTSRQQRVHEAVLALIEAITRLPASFPAQVTQTLRDESSLLSPPVIFVAQQLVNVIRHVLDCERVSLRALRWPEGYLHFVAGSGFTAEEEESERATNDLVTLSDVCDETLVARLLAGKEVVVRSDCLHLPPGWRSLASASILAVPLFGQERMAGILCIIKPGLESVYTPEEVEVVKAVAALAVLIVRSIRYSQAQAEAHTRKQVLYEVKRLSSDFLALASHELRTPLAGILGNLQLAQRRLETFKQQSEAKDQSVSVSVAQIQQSLISASQSAQLQQRMINDLIDDARIQANQLNLCLKPHDLLALLKAAIDMQHRLAPDRTIILEPNPEVQKVPVIIDAERITRAFTTYLANALLCSPVGEPVTVRVAIKDQVVRVSVHCEGPGISSSEQVHLWERFYRAKGSAVQHELDLSLGLGLYLCRAFIEHHGGYVGVESAPGRGATFWFTLPVSADNSSGIGLD